MRSAGLQHDGFNLGVLVVAGPSGVGKSTIIREVLKRNPQWTFSISATTRPLRAAETDGVDYYHVTREAFQALVEARGFLEYAFVFGNYYGTMRSEIERATREQKHLLIEIDTVGCYSIRAIRPDIPMVGITPPDLTELNRRLQGRGTETPESLRERQANVFAELQRMRGFDYVIVNDELEMAVERMISIMRVIENGLHHVAESLDWILDHPEDTDEA